MVSSKILTPSFIIEDCTGRKTLLTHQVDKDIDPPWTNCDSRYHHHRSTYLITDADFNMSQSHDTEDIKIVSATGISG